MVKAVITIITAILYAYRNNGVLYLQSQAVCWKIYWRFCHKAFSEEENKGLNA
jgi:hypothetical protein